MGRGVLVAGGTGALGGAVLEALAEGGWDVTATWVEERERDRVEGALGDRVQLVQADLFDPEAVGEAVASVEGLGAVVNLVGGYASGSKVHEVEPEELDRMLQLNLKPG